MMSNLEKAKQALDLLESMEDHNSYSIEEAKIAIKGFIRNAEFEKDLGEEV